MVVEGRSSKLGAAIENHSDLLRLLRMIHTMMGNVPRLTRNFLRDLLCVTFIDYFVDEGYVVVPVLVILDHFLSLSERSFDGSLSVVR